MTASSAGSTRLIAQPSPWYASQHMATNGACLSCIRRKGSTHLISSGTLPFRCSYVCSLLALPGTQPNCLLISHTCVSTGNSALPMQNMSTHATVLGPTPLNCVSWALTSSQGRDLKCSRLKVPVCSRRELRMACGGSREHT